MKTTTDVIRLLLGRSGNQQYREARIAMLQTPWLEEWRDEKWIQFGISDTRSNIQASGLA